MLKNSFQSLKVNSALFSLFCLLSNRQTTQDTGNTRKINSIYDTLVSRKERGGAKLCGMSSKRARRGSEREPFCHLCMKSFHMCFSVANFFLIFLYKLWQMFTKWKVQISCSIVKKERKKCPIARECREKKGIGCNLKGSTDERNWINARWMNYLQHYCCCCSLKLKVFLELFPCIKFNSWATENSSIHHLMNFKPQTIWFRFNKDV